MDPTVEQILAEYERRSADEAKIMHSQPEEFARRIDDFLISVGPATGRMLHLLATGANAKSILELGTSYGYSTIWLADAARATGGKVVSLELSQRKVDHAQAQLARAGLADFVECRVGSGVELSRKHELGPRP
jgi:predicted O-methyltransferase YrrM